MVIPSSCYGIAFGSTAGEPPAFDLLQTVIGLPLATVRGDLEGVLTLKVAAEEAGYPEVLVVAIGAIIHLARRLASETGRSTEDVLGEMLTDWAL